MSAVGTKRTFQPLNRCPLLGVRRTHIDIAGTFGFLPRLPPHLPPWPNLLADHPANSKAARQIRRPEHRAFELLVFDERLASLSQALAHVYFEEEPGRRSAAKLLTRDEARRIALSQKGSPRLNTAWGC